MSPSHPAYVLSLSYRATSDQWAWTIEAADTGRTVEDARTSYRSARQAATEGKAALAALSQTKILTSSFQIPTLADLIAALADIEREASARGHHPSTVYANMRRVALVEECLTDGSKVLNLDFAEGEP